MRRKRKVLDTSSIYVRGEDEFLRGWKPKGDSLLIEHQWILERNLRICLTEKVKHIIDLRKLLNEKFIRKKSTASDSIGIKKCSSCGKLSEKLTELEAIDICSCTSQLNNQAKTARMPTSFSRSNLAALAAETIQVKSSALSTSNSYSNLSTLSNQASNDRELTRRELKMCKKCIELIQMRIPTKPYTPANHRSDNSDNNSRCDSNSSSPDLLSPDQNPYNQLDQVGKKITNKLLDSNNADFNDFTTTSFGTFSNLKLCLIPSLEESRLSKVVSKQGLLYHLELIANKQTSTLSRKYIRRFVVVKRPYLFLYNSEKEMEELGVVNLTNTELIVSEINKDNDSQNQDATTTTPKLINNELNEVEDTLQIAKTFILKGMISCNVFQCLNNQDVCEWLYAINPLFAGQIRSQQARKRRNENLKRAT